jgi:Uncharacterised nucleotidyltransferase
MHPVTSERLQGLLKGPLDWDYVLTVGQRHGVLPLVYWHLRDVSPSLVPAAVGQRLRLAFEQTQRRNLYFGLHLGAILKRFAAHDIPAIPYKGPTLAVMAYGRPGFREFLDLDILVKKEDVLRAKDVLTAEGYRAVNRLTAAQERALVESQHAYVLSRPDGIVVELHWEVSPRHVSLSPEPGRFWERLEPVTLHGTTVYTLPADVLLPSLCEHGNKHIWERLAWICDIAELVQARPELDWPGIIAKARRAGSERMLGLGLRLASDLLGAPMPEAARHAAESDPAILPLVDEVRTRLFQNRGRLPGLLEQARFHLRVQERWSQRLRYCWLALTTVTVEDWEQRPLPRALSFLHYPMRLLRLAGGAYEHRHH